MYCESKTKCGPNSITLIEGSQGEKVTSIRNNSGINYALPKSMFAKLVLDKIPPFDSFNFDSFILMFELIKKIINEDN